MKYLKKYEKHKIKKHKFERGCLVKLTNNAIDDFIYKITHQTYRYEKSQLITKQEIEDKVFYIDRYIYDKYVILNIDQNDNFFWGETGEDSIRRLTPEEIKDFELKKSMKKYNI